MNAAVLTDNYLHIYPYDQIFISKGNFQNIESHNRLTAHNCQNKDLNIVAPTFTHFCRQSGVNLTL